MSILATRSKTRLERLNMCGLVAIISKNQSGFYQTDKTIFLQMLISDMFRGMDSTGCFAVNTYGNLKMIKDASPASFFIGKKESTAFFDTFISDQHIMVGHNRKATMGNIISENAHPFIEGNICLVHNGTLNNHKNLADTVVDSHAICKHINDHGYKSMFKTIDGAYALIWYNAEEKKLYFARNAERPLFFVETATKLYLASEEKMLDWILDRNNIGKYTIQNVPTDKVFKFDLESHKLECETKPKKEFVSKNYQLQTHSWIHQPHQKRQKRSSKLHSIQCSDTSSETLVADIDTYETGEVVPVKCVDFDINEAGTKLVCESLDGLETAASVFLPHSQYSQKECDEFINAQRLMAPILCIKQKNGIVTLILKTVTKEIAWKTRDGSYVNPVDLEEAGAACYTCGTILNKEKDVEFAEISTNSAGKIMYITCEHCIDQMEHIQSYRGTYGKEY
jgi:hypothetical protein